MNRCGTYYPLSSHLDALLWCLYVFSQASSSQRRRFRVAFHQEKAPLLQWICWLKNNMFWSNNFFCICYHAGGSTKQFRRPKVKRCDEASSPSDALTPKERKTRLAGKMRTYLWVCLLTPTPHPHLPFPCFCKGNMRGSSKMTWIDVVRTTRYSLILMLSCAVFRF